MVPTFHVVMLLCKHSAAMVLQSSYQTSMFDKIRKRTGDVTALAQDKPNTAK